MKANICFLFILLSVFAGHSQNAGKSENADVLAIRKYAENLEAAPVDANDTTFGVVLPVLPESVTNAFKASFRTDRKEVEKAVVLILLKLYAEQVKCCHKAYPLWGEGFTQNKYPVQYYYLKITRECNPEKYTCGPLKTSMPYLWVMKNPYLSDYAPIKAEMDYITALKKTMP